MDLWRRQKTDSQLLITAVTGDLDSPTRQPKSTRTLRPGRSSYSLPACVIGMAQVGALFLLGWRDRGGRFAGGHGIAAHRILESGRREDERQADRFGANVLQTYPGIRRNKHEPPGVEIALLIAEPDVNLSALHQEYFILGQVFVFSYGRSRGKLFRTRHEMP